MTFENFVLSFLHKLSFDVFSFLYKLSFENNFCFLSILSCQTSFLVSKIENYFWKQKIRGKTVTKHIPSIFIPLPSLYFKSIKKIHKKKKKNQQPNQIFQPHDKINILKYFIVQTSIGLLDLWDMLFRQPQFYFYFIFFNFFYLCIIL